MSCCDGVELTIISVRSPLAQAPHCLCLFVELGGISQRKAVLWLMLELHLIYSILPTGKLHVFVNFGGLMSCTSAYAIGRDLTLNKNYLDEFCFDAFPHLQKVTRPLLRSTLQALSKLSK